MLSTLVGRISMVLLATTHSAGALASSAWSAPYPLPNVQSLNPYSITVLDFDTNGDGIIDYRFVGDVNRNGVLEWDDIQGALDGLCDPNADRVQNSADGKMIDLDGDGIKEPFCGTLHILPGEWVSRVVLDPSIYNHKDDQIWLTNYQGLWLRGSGTATTTLKVRYTRSQFCFRHHEAGCGGICSRESRGFITLSDFTFAGLPARTWGKRDCDGDGLDYDDPRETNYSTRVLQSGIVVWNTPPNIGRNVVVRDIVVSQADYNGVALGELSDLIIENVRVLSAGATGIMLSGVRDSIARSLHVENVNGSIAGGGVNVTTVQATNGGPEGVATKNLLIKYVVSINNHVGISVVAQGAGGISNVVFRDTRVHEPADITLDPRVRTLTTEFGIRLQDSGCLWDKDGDGKVDNPCYVTNVTFDGGVVVGAPSYGFSALMHPGGPNRNHVVRGMRFFGNGHKINTTESRDIDVTGVPGITFEGNTITGYDYNSDGIADLASLMRVESDNVVLRGNVFDGQVAGGLSTLVFANNASNIVVASNRFICDNSTYCNSLRLSTTTPNALVYNNIVDRSPASGTGIHAAGGDARISGNIVTGGDYAIESLGDRNVLLGNQTRSVSLATNGNDIRVVGADIRLENNVCAPAATWKYCIELGVGTINPVLNNNRNLTTLANVYLSAVGTLNLPSDSDTTPAGSSGASNPTPAAATSGGGCTIATTGRSGDSLAVIILLISFGNLALKFCKKRFWPEGSTANGE